MEHALLGRAEARTPKSLAEPWGLPARAAVLHLDMDRERARVLPSFCTFETRGRNGGMSMTRNEGQSLKGNLGCKLCSNTISGLTTIHQFGLKLFLTKMKPQNYWDIISIFSPHLLLANRKQLGQNRLSQNLLWWGTSEKNVWDNPTFLYGKWVTSQNKPGLVVTTPQIWAEKNKDFVPTWSHVSSIIDTSFYKGRI